MALDQTIGNSAHSACFDINTPAPCGEMTGDGSFGGYAPSPYGSFNQPHTPSSFGELLAENKRLQEENEALRRSIFTAMTDAFGSSVYSSLQAEFSSELKNHNGNGQNDACYRAGVMACMSILRKAQEHPAWP